MNEEEKINALRKLVDQTSEDLQSGSLSEDKARELITQTRSEAEKLIPTDMDKYDMIYGARFERLLEQFVLSRQES